METHQGEELTRNSSGNVRPQSSQLAEPTWTDLMPKKKKKNRIGTHELIYTLKKSTDDKRFIEPAS